MVRLIHSLYRRRRLVQSVTSGESMGSSMRPSKSTTIQQIANSDPPSSLYNKEPEFRAWLVEERKVNPETVSKDQTRKEFARFVEDYNTGASCVSHLPFCDSPMIFDVSHIAPRKVLQHRFIRIPHVCTALGRICPAAK